MLQKKKKFAMPPAIDIWNVQKKHKTLLYGMMMALAKG